MTRNTTGILRAPNEYRNFAGSGMFPAKTYEIIVFETGRQQNHIWTLGSKVVMKIHVQARGCDHNVPRGYSLLV